MRVGGIDLATTESLPHLVKCEGTASVDSS